MTILSIRARGNQQPRKWLVFDPTRIAKNEISKDINKIDVTEDILLQQWFLCAACREKLDSVD